MASLCVASVIPRFTPHEKREGDEAYGQAADQEKIRFEQPIDHVHLNSSRNALPARTLTVAVDAAD
jgi:hypothetical protein